MRAGSEMAEPHHRALWAPRHESAADTLAADLLDFVVVAHCKYERGYGPLVGALTVPAPRPGQARLRLLVELHISRALDAHAPGFEAILDYPDTGPQFSADEKPCGLIVEGLGGMFEAPLKWTGHRLLSFEPNPIFPQARTVRLSAGDAGEELTSTVCRFVAGAVVSLQDRHA